MIGSLTAGLMGASALGSVGAGLMGQAGANAGGQTAANSALLGASTAQNFNNDQINRNRQDASAYTSAGRTAIDQISQLMGWGSQYSNGGNDPWGYQNNPELNAAQQASQQANIQRMIAGSGAQLPNYVPVNALNTVSDTFTADPSYNWRVSEGNKALDRSAASKGMLLSGAQAKGLTDYNSNVASQEYGNWFNRFMGQNQYNMAANAQNFGQQQTRFGDQYGQYRDVLGDYYKLAGMGQQSSGQTAGLNSSLTGNTANAFSNAYTQGGIAAGQGQAQGANALASGVGSGINNALAAGYLFGGGGGGSSYGRAPGSGTIA